MVWADTGAAFSISAPITARPSRRRYVVGINDVFTSAKGGAFFGTMKSLLLGKVYPMKTHEPEKAAIKT
ncbi:hypothetical protein GCM10010096_21050 [Alcaligenes pakistanensis]|uniref:Uncharacterized protein n=1 Tax=Alcaligenes pakistanensis TaxID=1482717 RepID=A0A8H9IQC7_9BURK|nr:hypothetical protein GCM10010096_21050 [Alcaligenes pakistanensis]